MLRLTKRMEDGTYQANDNPELPGENSYAYKNAIIDRCGKLEDLLETIFYYMSEDCDSKNLRCALYNKMKENKLI